jgi:aryl-alcohol dehydrogenase-like predicted oxidoreductase
VKAASTAAFCFSIFLAHRRENGQHLLRMEFRTLGRSGLKVPVLSFGTGTFGGGTEFFKAWGASDVAEATRLVDICLEAGAFLFDTADIYSNGLSETILGKAVAGRRDKVLISTKATFKTGPGPNDLGSSRYHLIQACEASLRRLGTDYIDIYHLHGFDALSPVEEVLSTLNQLVVSGKVRYIACSNFSGWHLMKSLGVSDKYGWAPYVGHQVYYSLIGREYEWELISPEVLVVPLRSILFLAPSKTHILPPILTLFWTHFQGEQAGIFYILISGQLGLL